MDFPALIDSDLQNRLRLAEKEKHNRSDSQTPHCKECKIGGNREAQVRERELRNANSGAEGDDSAASEKPAVRRIGRS